MAKKQVPAEVFVTTVMTGIHQGLNTVEVAAQLGMTPGSVQARASKYRSLGIAIPKFPRGKSKGQNVAALIVLAEKLNKRHRGARR